MIVSFKPSTISALKPKLTIKPAEINSSLSGPEGPIIYAKRLSPDRLVAVTSDKIYFITVGRGLRINNILERPKGGKLVDITPRRIVFATDSEIIAQDHNGKELFRIPLREPPIALAAYRDYIAVSFPNRISLFYDESKIKDITVLNAVVVKIIKHRKAGMLVAGTSIGRVITYDINTDRLRSYKPLSEPVKHLAALSDGNTITFIAAGEDYAMIMNNYGLRRRIEVSPINAVAIGNGVAYIGSDAFVLLYRFSGRFIRRFQAHASRITTMDARPILLTGSELGGIAVRDKSVKRLGKHIVHLAAGSSFFGYVNDGRLFRYTDNRVRRMRVGVVRSLDASPGRLGVFATDKDVREVVGTRTRYVAEEPYSLVSASRSTIAIAKDNKVVVKHRGREISLEFPERVTALRVRDLGGRTFIAISADKIYDYTMPRKLLKAIDAKALDIDLAMLMGELIIAAVRNRINVRSLKRKLATFMRSGRRIRLARSNDRLLMIVAGENVYIRDITDITKAGEHKIPKKASSIAALEPKIAIGSYGLDIATHEGTEYTNVRASRGIEANFKLEGFTDISAFLEDPAKELLKAKEEGRLGELINTLVDRGIARIMGNVVFIDLEPKNVEGLERIYR